MGDILHFHSLRRSERSARPPSEGATILFFLGVRYERWLEPEAAPAGPKKAQRPRAAKPTKPLGGRKRKA